MLIISSSRKDEFFATMLNYPLVEAWFFSSKLSFGRIVASTSRELPGEPLPCDAVTEMRKKSPWPFCLAAVSKGGSHVSGTIFLFVVLHKEISLNVK